MSVLTVVALVLLVLVGLGWWLSWTATRMDRLHARVESSRAELETQLIRRGSAASELATSGLLDPASSVLLAQAAHEARDSDEQGWRKDAQTSLTQALHAALEESTVALMRTDPVARGLLEDLTSACQRVVYARRIHNDAVSAALRLRNVRRVRWFALAGHAPLPQTCLMHDETPPALLG
jgi:hypothetical protein